MKYEIIILITILVTAGLITQYVGKEKNNYPSRSEIIKTFQNQEIKPIEAYYQCMRVCHNVRAQKGDFTYDCHNFCWEITGDLATENLKYAIQNQEYTEEPITAIPITSLNTTNKTQVIK